MAVTVVSLSQITMTMLDAKVGTWLKREGDAVQEGEPLLEVDTDKTSVEIPAPASGYVRKILAKEGDVVRTGGNLCLIAEQNDDLKGFLGETRCPISETATSTPDSQEALFQDSTTKIRKPAISQVARELAKQHGLDLRQIPGTGPGGLIVKADIEQALTMRRGDTVPIHNGTQAADASEIIPLGGIRKLIAERLSLSKHSVADVTTVTEADMTEIAKLRQRMPVHYTAFVVKAAARALQDFPFLNSSLVGQEIHLKKNINICVAVAIDSALVTPVIRHADKKPLIGIAQEIEQLSRKSKEQMLTPEDLADGTFTVTNSGVFGSLFFTPIINYPQAAILGMGKVVKSPVVRDDVITIAPMMYLCLTYDHRIVDGASAVMFLQNVRHYLETPHANIVDPAEPQ
jgi:pyruvate/2-oxoglutarate dehydrogenase complex dihydrolipoamide acyltransferase (E2) component